jgi:lactoylglutathione lyase
MEFIHTCYRITDPERSIAFYEALGLEKRRELPIREEAVNYFLGVPGKEIPELELTYNFGVDSYELGTAYGHIALTIEKHERDARQARRTRHRAGATPVLGTRGRLAAVLRTRP